MELIKTFIFSFEEIAQIIAKEFVFNIDSSDLQSGLHTNNSELVFTISKPVPREVVYQIIKSQLKNAGETAEFKIEISGENFTCKENRDINSIRVEFLGKTLDQVLKEDGQSLSFNLYNAFARARVTNTATPDLRTVSGFLYLHSSDRPRRFGKRTWVEAIDFFEGKGVKTETYPFRKWF